MKNILFLMCMANCISSQNIIKLSNGFDAVQYPDSVYPWLRKKIGKPDKIEKDAMQQMFCGMTRGHHVHFIYKNFKVNVTGWKRTGYVHNLGKGEAYYNSCHINECFISGRSNLLINGKIKINGLDTTSLIKAFGRPFKIDIDEADTDGDDLRELPADVKQSLKSYVEDLLCYSYQDSVSQAWFHFYFFPKGKLSHVAVNDEEPYHPK